MSKHTIQELYQYQSLPLNVKVAMTKDRIRGWVREFGEDGVYVSFSGGKDSTVLLHLVREEFPNIEAVFVDVPTQYPELREFAQTFDNVTILKPKISFMQVCDKYGFPIFSKEISKTVYYARKYVDKVKDIENGATDRQAEPKYIKNILTDANAPGRTVTNERTNERTNEAHSRIITICRPDGDRPKGKQTESSMGNDKDGDYP